MNRHLLSTPRWVARCPLPVLLSVILMGCNAELEKLGEATPLAGTQKVGAAVPANSVRPAKSEIPQGESRPNAQQRDANTPDPSGYRIGTMDVLDITVYRVPELSKTIQVGDSGIVNLPLVGDVVAGGRSALEVERELARRLGEKYLQNPQVTVLVREFNSQRATVEGAVRRPGVFPLRGRTTLMQLAAQSGGVDDEVASGAITIFRANGDKKETLHYDLAEIRSGSLADPDVQSGDLIVVDVSAGKQAFNNIIRLSPVGQALRPANGW